MGNYFNRNIHSKTIGNFTIMKLDTLISSNNLDCCECMLLGKLIINTLLEILNNKAIMFYKLQVWKL